MSLDDDDHSVSQFQKLSCERCLKMDDDRDASPLLAEMVLGVDLPVLLCASCFRDYTMSLDATPLSLAMCIIAAEIDVLMECCKHPAQNFNRSTAMKEAASLAKRRFEIERAINIASVKWLATGEIPQELYRDFLKS